MDPTQSIFDTLISQYGPPGLIIAGLGYWILRLQARADKLTDDMVTLAVATAKSQAEHTAAMNRLTEWVMRDKRGTE